MIDWRALFDSPESVLARGVNMNLGRCAGSPPTHKQIGHGFGERIVRRGRKEGGRRPRLMVLP